MRAKRQRDQKAIDSFQQGRQERQESPADPVPQKELPQKEEGEEDMAESVEVWAAGAAGGVGGDNQVPAALGGRQWCSPCPRLLSVEVGHSLSLQSAGEGYGD